MAETERTKAAPAAEKSPEAAERIKRILSELGVRHYTVEKRTTESAELFFVKRDLDTERIKEITEYTVTVFRDGRSGDGKPLRGQSDAVLTPGMTDGEIKDALRRAIASAECAFNPAYELYKGETSQPVAVPSGLNKMSVGEAAVHFAEALYKAEDAYGPGAFINSAEIFSTKTTVRFSSSEGFCCGYEMRACFGEFVVQCREPLDVEQYFPFRYYDDEADALTEKGIKALAAAYDRAHVAGETKKGTYDVILSDDNLKILVDLYTERTEAAAVYSGYFDVKLGDFIQPGPVAGEKIDIFVEPTVPFSREGIPMKERRLISDGRVVFLQADQRFASYMHIEPTGHYAKVRLGGGTVPLAEMKKNALYPVSFSDFQMDPLTGKFGGEIRLAYLFDEDGKPKILTGGSISGSLLEKQNNLTFSEEQYSDASYSGPLAIKIKGVSVAGV